MTSRDVLCKNVFGYYDESKLTTTKKKVTISLKGKIVYKGLVSSTARLLKRLDFQHKITHAGHKFLIQ
jgi:hypothetical protein